jgi:transcriptional regulator with XRE-family HTH domain
MNTLLCRKLSPVTTAPHHHGIGWAIRRVRKAQHLTLENLAIAIGSDAGNLSRVERGTQEVTEDALVAIATELKVSVSDLWRLAEGGDTGDSGRMLALSGRLHPEQLERVLEFGEFLLERQSD